MESLLIELPWMRLPRDMAWRVRFVEAVEGHARKLGLEARFRPPRFCGYFFNGSNPVVMAGRWTVLLDENPLLTEVRASVERLTSRRFSISSASLDEEPEYMLINDGHDGACWLWNYEHGRRFVEANEPVKGEDHGSSPELPESEGPKRHGP